MRGRGQAGSGLGQPPLLRPRIGAKWWAAPGCPRLRPASANQPMAPCWPPTGAVLSTRLRTRSAREDAPYNDYNTHTTHKPHTVP